LGHVFGQGVQLSPVKQHALIEQELFVHDNHYQKVKHNLNYPLDMSDDEEIPEDINVHKQIWGKDANRVKYGNKTEDDEERCPICNSRIDEFGYCGCGGKLGVG
jgi:hypothetical protein